MKKLVLLASLVLTLIFTGCSDDEPSLLSKTITAPDGLSIELTWTINGETEGYQFVDIDFVVDDLTQQGEEEDYEQSSGNGYDFESTSLGSEDADGTYFVAPFIYNFETDEEEYVTSNDIVLTFKIYSAEDDSKAIQLEQKFTYQNHHSSEAIAFAKYSITKKGDSYNIKELKSVREINSGWYEN